MRNIKGYGKMLAESRQEESPSGDRIWVAFAGDDNVFAVGFYGAKEEAENAIRERYDTPNRRGAKMATEDPHVFGVDPRDPKGVKMLIGYAIDALEAYEPWAADLDEDDKIVHLLKRLVSLGIGLDDIIGFEHMRNFANRKRVWDLDKLLDIGLFDGDIGWIPDARIRNELMRSRKSKGLFGI